MCSSLVCVCFSHFEELVRSALTRSKLLSSDLMRLDSSVSLFVGSLVLTQKIRFDDMSQCKFETNEVRNHMCNHSMHLLDTWWCVYLIGFVDLPVESRLKLQLSTRFQTILRRSLPNSVSWCSMRDWQKKESQEIEWKAIWPNDQTISRQHLWEGVFSLSHG